MLMLARSALLFFSLATVAAAQSAPYPAQVDLGDLLPANGDGSLGFVVEGLTADNGLGWFVTRLAAEPVRRGDTMSWGTDVAAAGLAAPSTGKFRRSIPPVACGPGGWRRCGAAYRSRSSTAATA